MAHGSTTAAPAVKRRGYNFAQLPEWVLYHPDLNAQAVRLFAVLDRFAGDGEDCYPSRRRLAERMHCSRDTVDRALAQLVKIGAVEVTPRRRLGDDEDGGQTSNLYTLNGAGPGRTDAQGGPQPSPGPGRTDAQAPAAETRHQERESVEREPVNNLSSADAADEERPEVRSLCDHLADRIEANGSKRPTVSKTWLNACRLMLDRDGRTPDQVRRAIDWCQDDEFWRANVMSMPKLRQQFDTLRLRAKAQSAPSRTRKPSKGERALAAVARLEGHHGDPLELVR